MTNYLPPQLSKSVDVSDDFDYNEEVERMIQDRLDDSEAFANELYEREEGI